MARFTPNPSPARTSSASALAAAHAVGPTRQRCFTTDEATATLVYLGPIVAEVQASFARLADLRERLDAEAFDEASGPTQELVGRHQREMAELARLVDEVQAVGAQVRDFEAGAVAFPGVGRGVPENGFLSWICGEESVDHAHGPDEPTEARRPLRRKARRRAA